MCLRFFGCLAGACVMTGSAALAAYPGVSLHLNGENYV
jgi:hypothetical protein